MNEVAAGKMCSFELRNLSNKSTPIDVADATKAFKGLRTVFDNNEKNQHGEIEKHLLALVKKKDKGVGAGLSKARCTVSGYDKDAEKRSGEHQMKVMLDNKLIATNKVWINKTTTGKGINIGISGANSSEKAAAILIKNKTKIDGLILKKGDGEHKEDLLWRLNGVNGSLPLTTHTKGTGGKNEKAALKVLKKAFGEAGYI